MSASLFRREFASARKRRLFFEPLEERSLLAAVITVNSTLDTDVRDSVLTLREAILINNRTLAVGSLTAAELAQVSGAPMDSDRDTIGFNIPGSGVRTISISTGTSLPTITAPVVIDGYTQPDAAQNSDPNGFDGTLLIELKAPPAGSPTSVGLGLRTSDSVVRGLVINGVSGGAGIAIDGGSNNVIEGNFIGTDVTGMFSMPNQYGIDIFALSGATATSHRIGGSQAEARNVISGNSGGGIRFVGSGTLTSTVIQGNFIGTNPSGTAAVANGTGILVFGVNVGTTIGGSGIGEGNVISGNQAGGISLGSSEDCNSGATGGSAATGSIVRGNKIGTDVSGTQPLGNGTNGIAVGFQTPSTNTIGGLGAGEGNIIAFNGLNGVAVVRSQAAILSNSIFSNARLGIHHFGSTNCIPSSNDPGDADSGPNNRQNFPEISAASQAGGTLSLRYTVPSLTTNSAYPLRVEFFRADGDGQEGKVFLGSDVYVVGEAGTAKTTAFAPIVPVVHFDKIVATATDNNGHTSEFGTSIAVQASSCLIVTSTLDSGLGSLREAINCANITPNVDGPDAGSEPDADVITFAIPGAGVKTIAPLSALPTISEAVVIDAYSQPEASVNTNGPGQAGNAVLLVELNGAAAGASASGLWLDGVDDSIVKGLVINRFAQGGVRITNGDRNRIEGNYIGTNPLGTAALPNGLYGVSMAASVTSGGSADNVIGGSSAAARNLISGNQPSVAGSSSPGVQLLGSVAGTDFITGTIIRGNFIGTDVTGKVALANSTGIDAGSNTRGTIIGGSVAGQGNLISGNQFDGIGLGARQVDCTSGFGNVSDSVGNVIQGNRIGTDISGVLPLGNGSNGIVVSFQPASSHVVGGLGAGEGNIIAFNGLHGIAAFNSHTAIYSNSIFSNALLGINLGFSCSATENDPGDADSGPNNLQNFPEIAIAAYSGGDLTVDYAVPSTTANSSYPLRVEFFKADSAGEEGRVFVGADTYLAAEANTTKTFAFAPLVGFAPNEKLVATATDSDGNTSEFSASFSVPANVCLTVTNTLDSGPGSLRDAITCANNALNVDGPDADALPDPDVIVFAIPSAGVKSITPTSPLPSITEAVVIDGYSQPGTSVNSAAVGNNGVLLVELNGASAGLGANGLRITSGGSTVKGLVINRFGGNGILLETGGGNTIAGNFIGTNSAGSAALGNGATGVRILQAGGNTIGGTTASARNVISGNLDSGIFVFGGLAAGNTISGNYVGVAASGMAALGNGPDGIVIQAPNTTIGGTQSGAGNVISGNGRAGVVLFDTTVNNVVAGNLIGVNAAGTAAVPNQAEGIGIHGGATNNVIGGAAANAGNVISGNVLDGIVLFSGATQNDIAGNFVGTSRGGAAAIPNGRNGIRVANAPKNSIGEGNTIANNGGAGIVVIGGAALGNSIFGNSIFANAGLGIDLGDDGVTVNDQGDADTGPNGLQNFPVITGVTTGGGNTFISGRLESTPNSLFRLEFFASDMLDASGFGEGQRLIGTIEVTTNAAGRVVFTTPGFAGIVPAGSVITVTATTRIDDDQNPNTPLVLADTSEFSLAMCSLIVTSNADGGLGSLRAAIGCANNVSNIDRDGLAGTDPDPITFAIAGSGTHTITLASSLPEISEAVTIDGYSQSGTSVNTLAEGNDAVLLVEINAAGALAGTGVLHITGGSSTVRGLVINRSPGPAIVVPAATGASNRFEGNFLGTNAAGNAALPNGGGIFVATPSNVIGGETPAARNVIVTTGDAVRISSGQVQALGTVVKGNYLGTNAAGTGALPGGSRGTNGVFIEGAANNTIGGTSVGSRNVIANFGVGVNIFGGTASVNTVQGNFIGTNAAGLVALPNGLGIQISQNGVPHNSGNLIGGAVTGAGNLVSGNGAGIVLHSDFNTIQGNFIGVDFGGVTALPNSGVGIEIDRSAVNNLIGGTVDGAANIIANNAVGILAKSGTSNSFLTNSTYANAGLGIDLVSVAPGATPNDAGDGDDGPNQLQNFPQIISAVPGDIGGITINYFVPTAPANATFPLRIEFFKADAGGEGQIFLGVDTFTVDDFAAGPKTILLSPIAGVGLGDRLVATATDSTLAGGASNTSEFNGSVVVTDGSVCSLIVTNTLDSGLGSLRAAIDCANATANIDFDGLPGPDADLVTFAIAADDPRHFYYVNDNVAGQVSLGSVTVTTAATDAGLVNADPDWPHSWFSIEIMSVLPEITEGVVIDGYTQAGASGNTRQIGSDAVLKVEVAGGEEMTPGAAGIFITGGNSTLRGLVVNRMACLELGGRGAIVLASDFNFVEGNFIGTDVSGTVDLGNDRSGVQVATGANNHVGGTARSARNLISGNGDPVTGGGGIGVGGFFNDQQPGPIGTRILNNYIGTNADGTAALANATIGIGVGEGLNTQIGGDDDDDGVADGVVASRNVIGGHEADGISVFPIQTSAFDVIIQGNFVGLNAAGTAALPNGNGILVGGDNILDSDVQIGGVTPGAGNVLSGNGALGLWVSNVQKLDVQGNLIGTDAGGTIAIGNGFGGILVEIQGPPLDYALTIGGTEPGARNVVSGNGVGIHEFGYGILAAGASGGFLTIQRNLIGTGIDGVTPLRNRLHGVELLRPALVGGVDPALGNVIAHNGLHGVVVRGTNELADPGVAIVGNSIFTNGLQGIHLGGIGIVLTNDLTPTPDADEGPNRLQNHPVITEATLSGGLLTLTYSVPSAVANSTYPLRVEFFLADAAGLEGQTFLGSDIYTADDFLAGNKSIVLSPHSPVVVGGKVLATATDSLPAVRMGFIGPLALDAGDPNNTSEFSPSISVQSPVPPQADLSVTKTDGITTAVPGDSLTYTIVVSNAGPAATSGAGEIQTVTVSGVIASGYLLTFNNQTTVPLAITATADEVREALSSLANIGGVGGSVSVNQTGNVYTISFGGSLAGQNVSQLTASTIGSIAVTINTVQNGMEGAIFTDVFPAVFANTTYASVAAGGAAGNTLSGSGNIFDNLSLPAGASVTYTVTGTVSPSATGTLSNTASVTTPAGITDTSPGNNSATDTNLLTPRADLSITKTDSVTSVAAGGGLTYTIILSNTGPSAVTGATVTDMFPAVFSNPTFTATGSGGASGFASGSGNILQSVDLPVNTSITYIVTGTLSESARGTLSNTASVSVPAGVTDPNLANGTAVDIDSIISADTGVGLVIGADAHSRGKPVVGVYDSQGVRTAKFLAYGDKYRGGVRVATGDVNGDGIAEIITAPGGNHAPLIKVFTLDGVELTEFRFLAYAANFTGGVFVAVGDVVGDGLNDIVVSSAKEGKGVKGLKNGGTEVRVYENKLGTNPGEAFVDNAPDRKFLAFPKNVVGVQFLGGGTVATGDVQPGGKLEVIVGSGPGIRATARAFNVEQVNPTVVRSWLPFDKTVRGGIFVSAGRIDGDAAADVVFGAWQGRDGLVEIRSGATGAPLRETFKPYVGLPRRVGSQSGLRVVARDLNGDGAIDRVLAGQGSDGRTKQVVQFGPLDSTAADFVFENDADFIGGFHLG